MPEPEKELAKESAVVSPRACYGHTADGPWELLKDHLRLVAEGEGASFLGARGFADAFGAAPWGEIAGYWHDLGKYSDEFQDYLERASGFERSNAHVETSGRVDHSTAGAQHAASKGAAGRLLAFCIAGHHGGISDDIGEASLEERLTKPVPRAVHAPSDLLARHLPPLPRLTPPELEADIPFQIAFFTRMLFSSLVDADFLATETFMSPERCNTRKSRSVPTIDTMQRVLDDHLRKLNGRADPTPVNHQRSSVLESCIRKAELPPGFFRLTVPTGGGKTLSSLAFALNHAQRFGMRRVVYAIPFTSIIEQNADVFRNAMAPAGTGAVLEHHSNFDPPSEDRWSRLASENWDAPLVVTTTVQLYESLFHNKPSRCRKLHNIANSVIILDEAQSIPVRLLRPTLAALKELVLNYGCSVLLCTATQPAVGREEDFGIGISNVREVIDNVPALFSTLRRVRVEQPRALNDDGLVAELAAEPRVLCIVRTKPEACAVLSRLCDLMGEDPDVPLEERSCLHLSTSMCPEHRTHVIALIRKRLYDRLPCRVVSTNLIEAGVDVDFPVVYRALAGLDAVAQAAGRCNREGLGESLGRVVLYENPDRPVPRPMQELKLAIDDARRVLARHDDPLDPEAVTSYFREHYWKRESEWDAERVMECFQRSGHDVVLQFRTAAERYRLINDEQSPVVVPWGERGKRLVAELQNLAEPAGWELRRRCQRFAVGLRPHVLRQMLAGTTVTEPPGELGRGLYFLTNSDAYGDMLGLDPSVVGYDPDQLIEGGD